MSAQGKFIIFCAEQYKAARHLTGKQLSELFGSIFIPVLRHCTQPEQTILLRI